MAADIHRKGAAHPRSPLSRAAVSIGVAVMHRFAAALALFRWNLNLIGGFFTIYPRLVLRVVFRNAVVKVIREAVHALAPAYSASSGERLDSRPAAIISIS